LFIRHLKPGSGLFEQVEIDYTPLLDGGELPESSKLRFWAHLLTDAMDKAGRPIVLNPNTRGMLEHLGFVDVKQEVKRIPYNSWPPDNFEQDLGRWFNLGMIQGLQAMSLAPLTRMKGYDKDQVEALIADVKREMCNRQIRIYCTM
jgi:hypothetical protein